MAIALVLIAAIAGFTAYRFYQPAAADVGKASGLNWYSGVHAANELDPHIQFGNWRGRPIDMVHTFTKRDSWEGIIKAEPYLTDHKPFYDNKNHLYVISQPFYPEGGQGDQASCADGQYNDEWQEFGRTLESHGLNHRNTVIRIAWEFNGNFMDWRPKVPDNPTDAHIASAVQVWKRCWRNVAQSIKQTAPNIRTDWTLIGHDSLARGSNETFRQYDPYAAYPGNDVVDIVGIDDYDMYPPAKTDAEFDARCNRTRAGGTCDLATFARKNGKQLAVGEWGVVANCSLAAQSNRHGGDNALYVRRMAQLFNENRDILAYEGYYDDPYPGNVCSTLYRNNTDGSSNTKAKAEYLKWFGKKSPFGTGGAAAIGKPVYQNKLLVRPSPDNRAYYVRDGRASYIGNGAIMGCISVRRGAGSLQRVSHGVLDSYAPGNLAYCNYESEPGINFVRERDSNYVWLVQAGGTKLHVGVACVPDAYTTQHKKFRISVVANGEVAGHRKVGAFFGTPGLCGQLPG